MPATFPNTLQRTIKAPDNPMDRCTIVSIFPQDIEERKHTVSPGVFKIPAGEYEKPSLVVIGPSSWWKQLEDNQPLMEIVNSSVQMADDIINGYVKTIQCSNGNDITPGLFFVHGQITLTDLLTRTDYKKLLDKYKGNQDRWYSELIKLADGLWARTNGNPLAISDLMRLAARALGQNTKEWLQDFKTTETIKCIACGMFRNPIYPICPNCKTNIPEFEASLKKSKSA